MELPSALLGVALGTVILPSLVKHKVANDSEAFSKLVDWGLRLTLALAVPATVALAVIAVPILSTMFWGGKFLMADVHQTKLALWGYTVGLLGIISVKILAPSFYAKQDIRTPVKVGIATLIITQICNFIFVPIFKHAALSLSISIGAMVNALLLYYLLRRGGSYKPEPGWASYLLKIAVAAYAMGGVLWFAAGADATWFDRSLAQRLWHLCWLVCAGAATYFTALWIAGIRPKDFVRAAKIN
jgi:putative peptidoglycan lipid II flippase